MKYQRFVDILLFCKKLGQFKKVWLINIINNS